MALKQIAKPSHLVVNALRAQRVPVGGRVDRDDGLAQEEIGG